ncbi:hypothetical protein ACFYXN_20410 [Streptomyces griseus]|uniref:hypothetical protein n=1 Tax=Streptomyces griseus TaxID=1911 RepID=UPI00368C4236
MLQLRRIRLENVGHRAAGFKSLVLDLTGGTASIGGRPAPPVNVILWLRNGGGKSTLLSLLFSLLLPAKKDFIGALKAKSLAEYIPGGQVSHVIAEWSDSERPASGAVLDQWRNGQRPADPSSGWERLERRSYLLRPQPGGLDLDCLPVRGGDLQLSMSSYVKALEAAHKRERLQGRGRPDPHRRPVLTARRPPPEHDVAAVRVESRNGLRHHRRRLANGSPRQQRGPHPHRPPYVDNVHYSELADFFHAWLSAMRPYQSYPDMPSTRAVQEVQNAAPNGFQATAARVWRECRRVLKPGGCLLFSFHQSQTTGWCALMRSLSDAGFTVTTTRAVIAEVATSLAKTAAAEPNRIDVIVLCRDTADTPAEAAPELDQAAAQALSEIQCLREAGLQVGPGDVRTAVRAAVLSAGTRQAAADWETLQAEADQRATAAVVEFSTA